MASRKRHDVGQTKGHVHATPQTPLEIQAVNTHGFADLAHEIYLEIISYFPSVPVPRSTSSKIPKSSYPEIRRSRHETLLSLSQTSRSLRRFFLRYLWQRIEVREGMKTGNDTLEASVDLYSGRSRDKRVLRNYATELVRQLEIVTVRNLHLAQYVNYVDIFIGDDSITTVLAELARCLSLFPNLHTVQIDVLLCSRRSLGNIFERVFKKHSYPQIRNVFVMPYSQSLIQSCPEARRVGFTEDWRPGSMSESCLRTVIENCPRLEVLEEFPHCFWGFSMLQIIVNKLPHLRIITLPPSGIGYFSSFEVDNLERLNNLQTVTLILENWSTLMGEKEEWIERVKRVLIKIQRRDNLEKVVIIRDGGSERKILIPRRAA